MIISPSEENIEKAAKLIQSGGIVGFPTETVYGLGADAFNESAVRLIFEVKMRPFYNPLIVHIHSIEQLPAVAVLDDALREKVTRISSFWPGPLSLVLPKHPSVPMAVSGSKDTIAVRIPSHPVAREFLIKCETPVAAPSANLFSGVSATKASHVEDDFGNRVQLVIDGGPSDIGLESTIISLVEDPPRILRHGSITLEMLSNVIPDIFDNTASLSGSAPEEVLAPGMLKIHYSPTTPLVFLKDLKADQTATNPGLIRFTDSVLERRDSQADSLNYVKETSLSKTTDLNEIASKLFSTLREYDKLGLDLIVIDSCEELGLGRAIMDRLKRATTDK